MWRKFFCPMCQEQISLSYLYTHRHQYMIKCPECGQITRLMWVNFLPFKEDVPTATDARLIESVFLSRVWFYSLISIPPITVIFSYFLLRLYGG